MFKTNYPLKVERVCRETGDATKLKRYARKVDLTKLSFDDGWSPLHVTAVLGFRDCVEVLLSVGVSTKDSLDGDSVTALMLAAHAGQDDVVMLLLDAGGSLADTDLSLIHI